VLLAHKPSDNNVDGSITLLREVSSAERQYLKTIKMYCMVYVLDFNGNPLMPTEKHGSVRLMLRTGRARVVKPCPFTIQLTTEEQRYTQPVSLGVRCGSCRIGLSATTEKKELLCAAGNLRTDIVDLLSTRREARRTRRSRLRHRAARFDNRISSKKEGWLPPSARNRMDFHLKMVDWVRRILPVTTVTFEVGSYDIQKIKNPEISGEQYQQGEQLGFWNVREYVLARDGHKCQHCKGKSKDAVLNVHHIESRKTGGDAPNNLITLCETCHKAYHRGEIDLKARRGNSFRDAAAINVVKDAVYRKAAQSLDGCNVSRTYRYITKHRRIAAGLENDGYTDFRVISGNYSAAASGDVVLFRQVRRHNRQIHKSSFLKGGRLKKNQAPYLVFGYRLNDIVRYKGRPRVITGRRSSGSFALKDLETGDKYAAVGYKRLSLLQTCNRILVFNQRRGIYGVSSARLKAGVSTPNES